jgi:hypothetical protein
MPEQHPSTFHSGTAIEEVGRPLRCPAPSLVGGGDERKGSEECSLVGFGESGKQHWRDSATPAFHSGAANNCLMQAQLRWSTSITGGLVWYNVKP